MPHLGLTDFSKDRETLVLQIKWLLNEMEYAYDLISENNIIEAKDTLNKEFEDHMFMNLGKKV
ncbi:hypothetical protein [Paenibacillus sp. USHLN196]|uniref:hypothetical protein n=1 Tax=Paenibacillus sp. USHLN196 TaxID=3081291 RepID=UPI0030164BBB